MRTLAIFAALALAPLCIAQQGDNNRDKSRTNDSDMRRAIEFQHNKDRADARQERLERRRPSVDYSNAGKREPLKKGYGDPGERQWKKDKKSH